MRTIRIALAATLALAVADHAAAQIGESPIRIVIPYPAGGVGETAARMIADSMRTRLNRTVIVENKPGAAGRLGIQSVKDAPTAVSCCLETRFVSTLRAKPLEKRTSAIWGGCCSRTPMACHPTARR